MSFFSKKPNVPTLPEIYAELHKHKDIILVDVRTSDEYAREHAEGAQSIPLSTITKETANLLKKFKKVYVICQTGGRSTNAVRALQSLEVPAVNIPGGIESWKEHKLPIAHRH